VVGGGNKDCTYSAPGDATETTKLESQPEEYRNSMISYPVVYERWFVKVVVGCGPSAFFYGTTIK
jgi:hypothetical protein